MAPEKTHEADGEHDGALRDATKRAFETFETQARAFADQDVPNQEDRARLHEAYIDYMALRAAARGRGGWRKRGRRSRFRRFVAVRMAVSAVLFLPIWIAAILVIADRL